MSNIKWPFETAYSKWSTHKVYVLEYNSHDIFQLMERFHLE